MKLKNNRGVTGIDVAIAVAILTIFVALIATLFYNTANTSTKVERKATATNLAIQVIEGMKVVGARNFNDLTTEPAMTIDRINELNGTNIEIPNGYTITVGIEDYKNENVVKTIVVEVSYLSEKDTTEKVEIKTLVKNREVLDW